MGITQPGPGSGYAHEYTFRPDGSRGPSNLHPLVLVEHENLAAWVDEGIADDVRALWYAGIQTVASCQGDANHSRYIELADKADGERAASLVEWVVEVEPWGILRGHYDNVCTRSVPNPPSQIWMRGL